ncbi:hypothetical protein KP509_1Z066300 [Ceratopteris richardii]|nr:hypothetical protein KP509_1Z066300 [Ceratopteris richardii]
MVSKQENMDAIFIYLDSAEDDFKRMPFEVDVGSLLKRFWIFSKEAVEKERIRLGEELNRGYFDDFRDLKKHNGKLAKASQTLFPITSSVKFPELPVRTLNRERFTIPYLQLSHNETEDPVTGVSVTMICLAFRGHGQGLASSWVQPFYDHFNGFKNIRIYEVFYIDQWLLSLPPVRYLLLHFMRRKAEINHHDGFKRSVYAFGDSYDFRKALKITNILTGYAFLLDGRGRIRWQGFGQSTQDEIKWMISCTQRLLKEQTPTFEPLNEQLSCG